MKIIREKMNDMIEVVKVTNDWESYLRCDYCRYCEECVFEDFNDVIEVQTSNEIEEMVFEIKRTNNNEHYIDTVGHLEGVLIKAGVDFSIGYHFGYVDEEGDYLDLHGLLTSNVNVPFIKDKVVTQTFFFVKSIEMINGFKGLGIGGLVIDNLQALFKDNIEIEVNYVLLQASPIKKEPPLVIRCEEVLRLIEFYKNHGFMLVDNEDSWNYLYKNIL